MVGSTVVETWRAARARYVAVETAIGSIFNMAMGVIALIASGGGGVGQPAMTGLCLQTFMTAFMSVLIATRLTRVRRRRGRIGGPPGGGAVMPHNLLARALLAGLAGLALMAPLLRLALPPFLAADPSPAVILAVTAAYGLLLSVLIIPPAVLLALREALPGAGRRVR